MNASTLEQLAANSEVEFRRSRITTQITSAKNRIADLDAQISVTETSITTLKQIAGLSGSIDPALQSRGTRFSVGGTLVRETVLDLMAHSIEVSTHKLDKLIADRERSRELLANLEPALEKFEAELKS